jgi:DNA polymerase-3 subunit delta
MADDLAGFYQHLEQEGLLPVYLLQGDERLLVDQAQKRLLEMAVDDPQDAMAVTRLDLAEPGTSAREVIAACKSLGLFTPRQAVVVRGAETLERRTEDREAIAEYVDASVSATTLILLATRLKGNLGLVKRIKKKGRVLTFEPLKAYQVPRWIADEARRLGHPIDPSASTLIAEMVGYDLHRLRLVVEQLSLYVGPSKPIATTDVENVLASTRQHSIFELVDAVGERKLPAALRHLNAMIAHREPALRILALLIRHFRQLWQVSEARADGLTVDQTRERFSLHPFVAKKLWAQQSRFPSDTLLKAYDRLCHTDRRLKSTRLDDHLVMEEMIIALCR